MSEMVERLARVLAGTAGYRWEGLPSGSHDMLRGQARAAIAAMREPTTAMITAGWEHTGDRCWPNIVKQAWHAMIDMASEN